MNRKALLFAAMMALSTPFTASADTVHKMFKVSDAAFKTTYWDGENNTSNPVTNSFTIGNAFGAVDWEFVGGWWEDAGLDISGFDKLVIRVDSCIGNNLQFRIFTHGSDGQLEYDCPDQIVESNEPIEYEIPLADGLDDVQGKGQLELNKVHYFVFWNYWDTGADKTNPDNDNYDSSYVDKHPGASATVYLGAMYLERTLKNGEKDYIDLLKGNKMQFTDAGMAEEDPSYEASSIDNTGTLHMKENAEAGFFFDDNPADWSNYKYLVVVPQKPYGDGMPVIKYLLTDADDNTFDSGSFRQGFYNRARAAVQDLTAITTTQLDDQTYLENFDTKSIASLKWSLWGGVSTWDYGIAGVWISNTAPTYSTAFGDGTDNTGDYVLDNSSENTVQTICLPYAAALCGAQVYTLAGVDDPSNPSEIYAAPYYGILEAGKPYIIRTNSARNVTAFHAGADEIADPVANGALVADAFNTYYVEGGKNYLALNEDGDTFEAVADDDEIRLNSNTAYVDLNKLPQAIEQENGLVFSVTGAKPYTPDVTAIKGVKNDDVKKSNDGFIYDLLGRRVVKPTKGIYIQNGKKFIVK